MINHKYTENMEINFRKLEERILAINDLKLNRANDFREMIYHISIDNKPTLIVATGGSKIVAYYLQLVLERLGFDRVICEVIEPRDYFYKGSVKQFCNLIVVSASFNTNGVEEILNHFKGKKFLICEKEQQEEFEVVSWGNSLYDKEKSFISLASTLGPIALILDVTLSLNLEIGDMEIKEVNSKIKKLLNLSKNKMDQINFNFKDIDLIQIISGYETKCSSKALESNLIEIGLCSTVIHDKGSFCHGRSNLLFNYPNSYVIYLCHEKSKLDETIIDLIKTNYSNISILETSTLNDNYFWREYYLLLQIYYLSRKIAVDKQIDLTSPEYDTQLVKTLYKYKGEM